MADSTIYTCPNGHGSNHEPGTCSICGATLEDEKDEELEMDGP